jgi:endonuclease III
VKQKPFDIEQAIRLLRTAVAPFPKAALFELAADGYTSVFEVLVACILSIRTRDETTVPAARALFRCARTPDEVANLSEKAIDRLIAACTFHEPKAQTIRAIARQTMQQFGGTLPCDPAVL